MTNSDAWPATGHAMPPIDDDWRLFIGLPLYYWRRYGEADVAAESVDAIAAAT